MMCRLVFVSCMVCLFSLFSCTKRPPAYSQSQAEIEAQIEAKTKIEAQIERETKIRIEAAKNYVAKMTLREKCAQLILANVSGSKQFGESSAGETVPGGYLFFAYNFAERAEEIRTFTDSIASYCRKKGIIPPYLAADHEGGNINRIRSLSQLASAQEIAQNWSAGEAERLYAEQGELLASLGLHVNLAPVAESLTADNAAFLDARSYGNTENAVAYSLAAIRGYKSAGIACVIKHFPGNSGDDPHEGLPLIKADSRALEQDYIAPFERIIAEDSPQGVLMSHAQVLTGGDASAPACLSRFWVTEMLRTKLHFDGLIFSDDIYMSALRKNGFPPEKAAIEALKAGCDVIMISDKNVSALCNTLTKAAQTDNALAAQITRSAERIIAFKMQHDIL